MESMVFKGPERVFEVGCGTGRFLFSVMKKSSNVIGIDRDFFFLQFAKQRGEELGLDLKKSSEKLKNYGQGTGCPLNT